MSKEVSFIVPAYRSADTLARLVSAVLEEFAGIDVEIILVNDASPDSTGNVCKQLAAEHPGVVHYVWLRRNFGEHNAVMCGLHHAKGDAVAILDDDLQNPPSEVKVLLAELSKGYDVVFGRYQEKRHNILRNLGSSFNDWCATQFLGKPKDLYLCSFKVMRREVVQELLKYTGPYPYVDGLVLRTTSNLSSVQVAHHARESGSSNYTVVKLLKLWVTVCLHFSAVPLKILLVTGATFLLLAIVLVLSRIAMWVTGNSADAAVWLTALGFFLSGVHLLALGLVAEYLGRLYLEQTGTPQWVIKESSFSGTASER